MTRKEAEFLHRLSGASTDASVLASNVLRLKCRLDSLKDEAYARFEEEGHDVSEYIGHLEEIHKEERAAFEEEWREAFEGRPHA